MRLRIPRRLYHHIPLDQRPEAPAQRRNRRVCEIIFFAVHYHRRHIGQPLHHASRFLRQFLLRRAAEVNGRLGRGEQSFLLRGKYHFPIAVQNEIDTISLSQPTFSHLLIQRDDIVGHSGHARETVLVIIGRDARNDRVALCSDVNVSEYGLSGRLDFLIPGAFSRVEGGRKPFLVKLHEFRFVRHEIRTDNISKLRGIKAGHLMSVVIALGPKSQNVRRVGGDLSVRQHGRNTAVCLQLIEKKEIRLTGDDWIFPADGQAAWPVQLPMGQYIRHHASEKFRVLF